ncbi:S41 family peptidase [Paracidovorax citrulli]|uniref:S41 family peptidase n=1 Tax=Paracidovorax citrulli TaxID=80869 RepID=UPI0009E27570|nr:S41 family peptidase [Paracidovorax citrulli]
MRHDQAISQLPASNAKRVKNPFCSRDFGESFLTPPWCLGLLKTATLALVLVGSITLSWAQETLHDRIFASLQWREFRDAVMTNYVRPVTDAQLQAPCRQAVASNNFAVLDVAVVTCLQAVLKDLDTNSAYFSPEERQRMAVGPNGFVGIGLELRSAASRNGDIEIVSTIQGSAAERAGLLPGDLIFSIADKLTSGVPLMTAVQSMKGEAGSVLNLRVRRPGVTEPIRFSVRREQIRIQSVRASLAAPGVLWLKVSQLRDTTRRDILAEVARLERQSPQPPTQVILDLRSCPGGLLDALVGVAALWTPNGSGIVRTVDQSGPPGRLYLATPEDYAKSDTDVDSDPTDGPLQRLPLTILVNQQTAAGAEALAQILREKRQAKIFGQTTFGFTAIVKMLPLQSGAAFKMQIASMESPEGVSWEHRGVVPDVIVPINTTTDWKYGALPGDTELAAVLAAITESAGRVSW